MYCGVRQLLQCHVPSFLAESHYNNRVVCCRALTTPKARQQAPSSIESRDTSQATAMCLHPLPPPFSSYPTLSLSSALSRWQQLVNTSWWQQQLRCAGTDQRVQFLSWLFPVNWLDQEITYRLFLPLSIHNVPLAHWWSVSTASQSVKRKRSAFPSQLPLVSFRWATGLVVGQHASFIFLLRPIKIVFVFWFSQNKVGWFGSGCFPAREVPRTHSCRNGKTGKRTLWKSIFFQRKYRGRRTGLCTLVRNVEMSSSPE